MKEYSQRLEKATGEFLRAKKITKANIKGHHHKYMRNVFIKDESNNILLNNICSGYRVKSESVKRILGV